MNERDPAWIEIDLGKIRRNVQRLAEASKPAELMAVVKADAYGHGAVAVSRAALASGARRLAVATPAEGQELRRAGIAAPILVVGAFLPGQEEIYLEHRLTVTLASFEGIEVLAQAAKRRGVVVRVHIKVDTGMGRLGFLPDEVPFLVKRLQRYPSIELEGIYSHYACADAPGQTGVEIQGRRLQQVVAQVQEMGWHPAYVHLSNTAGVLEQLAPPKCNLVRTGIGIYGLYPSATVQRSVELQPALSLHARVTTVKRVPAGTGVSYGLTYRTPHETTLCTLPIGYANGVTRLLSHKAHVLLGGHRFPIVGVVCMNLCVVDVGDYPAKVGEEAVLIGRQGNEEITADEWAEHLGTINYEVVCMMRENLPRRYTIGNRSPDNPTGA